MKLITIVSIFNRGSTLYLVTVMKIEGVIISTLIQQVILGSLLFKRCRFNENQKSVIQKNFYISFALILFPLIFLKLGILGSVGLLLVLLIIIFNICMVLRNDTIHEVQSILRK